MQHSVSELDRSDSDRSVRVDFFGGSTGSPDLVANPFGPDADRAKSFRTFNPLQSSYRKSNLRVLRSHFNWRRTEDIPSEKKRITTMFAKMITLGSLLTVLAVPTFAHEAGQAQKECAVTKKPVQVCCARKGAPMPPCCQKTCEK